MRLSTISALLSVSAVALAAPTNVDKLQGQVGEILEGKTDALPAQVGKVASREVAGPLKAVTNTVAGLTGVASRDVDDTLPVKGIDKTLPVKGIGETLPVKADDALPVKAVTDTVSGLTGVASRDVDDTIPVKDIDKTLPVNVDGLVEGVAGSVAA